MSQPFAYSTVVGLLLLLGEGLKEPHDDWPLDVDCHWTLSRLRILRQGPETTEYNHGRTESKDFRHVWLTNGRVHPRPLMISPAAGIFPRFSRHVKFYAAPRS